MRKYLTKGALVLVVSLSFANLAHAQSLLPSFMDEFLNDWNNTNSVDKISGFIRLALTLAFGIVILAAVAYSILAAIKYIKSQGDAGQVEEANKAIKAIFQGVVAMFVGIIGVVLVFFIFNVALPEPNLPAVCVKCPEAPICRICSEGKEEGGIYSLDAYPNQTYNESQCGDTVNCPPDKVLRK